METYVIIPIIQRFIICAIADTMKTNLGLLVQSSKAVDAMLCILPIINQSIIIFFLVGNGIVISLLATVIN